MASSHTVGRASRLLPQRQNAPSRPRASPICSSSSQRAAAGRSSTASTGGDGEDSRLLAAAAADPVSFAGGLFAGFLALNLQQEPLRSWIQQTAAEAGLQYAAAVERLERERQERSS